jgi:fumarate reductase subunit D
VHAIISRSGRRVEEKVKMGIFQAKRKVLATIAPILVPVKDPGPIPSAM